MINFNLKDYEDFKLKFPKIVSNGKAARRNQILLDAWKFKGGNPKLTKWFRECASFTGLQCVAANILSMPHVYIGTDICGWNSVIFMGYRFRHPYIRIEACDNNGICNDGTSNQGFIRYYNTKTGAYFKMKIGRLIHSIIAETFGEDGFPPSLTNYLCEAFTQDWKAHVKSLESSYDLHVDDNFYKIYDSECLSGDFNSCMVDDEQYSFYENAVDASAAYITNEYGDIVARAVIFKKAVDQDGKTWRLCERQYSSDGDEVLKTVLVEMLYKEGYIDAHKKVGADCSSSRAFVTQDGTDLSDRKFHISCRLENGDTMSYQDSFKWYDMEDNIAYNYDPGFDTDKLDDTDDTFYTHVYKNYDTWNEEYTNNDLVTAYCGGSRFEVNEDRVEEDFISVDGEWHHRDDVAYCEDMDDYMLKDDSFYSAVLDKWFYYASSLEDAEREDANQEAV